MSLSKTLPIPDLRFEPTFRRALVAKAGGPEKPITWRTVVSVVFKDAIVMPFIQGLLYAGALMVMRPWLRAVGKFGYDSATLLILHFKRAVRYV